MDSLCKTRSLVYVIKVPEARKALIKDIGLVNSGRWTRQDTSQPSRGQLITNCYLKPYFLHHIYVIILAEAYEKYGSDNIKIYKSVYTPMYFSVTQRKVKALAKLITLLPDEKVNYTTLPDTPIT